MLTIAQKCAKCLFHKSLKDISLAQRYSPLFAILNRSPSESPCSKSLRFLGANQTLHWAAASEKYSPLLDVDRHVQIWNRNSFQIRRGSQDVFDGHPDRSALHVPLGAVPDHDDGAVVNRIGAAS